jgi:hypothetical protein
MAVGRVSKVKDELVTRYHRIANLYIAYTNSGSFADEFGREFFHAVGDVLNGTPVEALTLHHIDAAAFEEVVLAGVPKGGKTTGKRKSKVQKPAKKKAKAKAPARKKTKKKAGKPRRRTTSRRR